MKRYRQFIIGLLVGTALTFVALRYHVVRHEEGVSLVPRSPQPPLRSIYSDVRDWGDSMWEQHPEVAQALIANEQIEIISDESLDAVSLQVNEFYRQNTEKLQGLLSEYQTERAHAAIAEVETTSVSLEEQARQSGVTIGRFPQGAFQNPAPQQQQVPIVEEPQAPPQQQQQSPPPTQWRNPFHFQQRRSTSPTVGSDQTTPNSSDAVAQRSRDPWLRESTQVAQVIDPESEGFVSSIPAGLESQMNEIVESDEVNDWLPGLLSNLINTDGETMHGQAQPSTFDNGLGATADMHRSSIPEPEALREPIIQIRPF